MSKLNKIYTGDILYKIGGEFEDPGPLQRPWYSRGDYPCKQIYQKWRGRHKDVKITILHSKNRLIIECQIKVI